MTAFITKDPNEILRLALDKLSTNTPITSVGPGSVARALTEVVTTELGDFYSILDFNVSMGFVSSAQGRALDLLGSLYDTKRKTLSQVATLDKSLGSFYFYIDSPFGSTITIPVGTRVHTDSTNFIGQQYTYSTTEVATIPAGRLRAFVSIRPVFADSVITAGANTLTQHNFESPVGTTVKCTNPKPIAAQMGYEDDDAYRTRIIKSIRVASGGTEEALRFAALGVSGVRDVKLRSAPFGLGSAEIIVTPESVGVGPLVLTQVAAVVNRLRPVGVNVFVRQPDTKLVDLSANIVFRDVAGIDKSNIARRVEIGVLRYLNTLLPGNTLVYNQLIQVMLEATDVVSDITMSNLKVDGVEVLRRNFTPEDDQQLVPGLISITY